MRKLKCSCRRGLTGSGFSTARPSLGDAFLRVNVLPPESEWDGDMKLDGYMPDKEQWIIYVDGEEVARVKQREDIAGGVLSLLSK